MSSEIKESSVIGIKIDQIGILDQSVILDKNFLSFVRFCDNLQQFIIIIVIFKIFQFSLIQIVKPVSCVTGGI